jgi:CheY-like chemotaxis protein
MPFPFSLFLLFFTHDAAPNEEKSPQPRLSYIRYLALMAITIFLIDDDQDDQEIFLLALQKIDTNIDCRVAGDGAEGLKALTDRSFLPDFIFVDMNMPRINGIDCLVGIRRIGHLEHVKVIVYSTSADPGITAQCKAAGADEVLIKPPLIRELVESLRTILNIGENNE